MARAIAEGLERVDPDGAATYRDGLARFTALLDQKIPSGCELAAPLRGVKAVSYHQDLIYFANRFGLELDGTIETKPGVPATPGHLEELIAHDEARRRATRDPRGRLRAAARARRWRERRARASRPWPR